MTKNRFLLLFLLVAIHLHQIDGLHVDVETHEMGHEHKDMTIGSSALPEYMQLGHRELLKSCDCPFYHVQEDRDMCESFLFSKTDKWCSDVQVGEICCSMDANKCCQINAGPLVGILVAIVLALAVPGGLIVVWLYCKKKKQKCSNMMSEPKVEQHPSETRVERSVGGV